MQYINVGPGAKFRFLGDVAADQDGFRDAFVESFRNHVPGAIESLRKVVPVCRQLFATWQEFHSSDESRREVHARFAREGLSVPLGLNRNVVLTEGRAARPSFSWKTVNAATESFYPDLLPMRDGLKCWGERWHMADVDWFMDTALGTLEDWVAHPQLEKAGAYIPRGCGEWAAVTDQEALFSFKSDGWTPNMQHWSEFEAEIRIRFNSELACYRKRIVETAVSRGFHREPNKFRPEHFVWLALFHCADWDLESIREKHGKSVNSRQAIHGAVKDAAKLIGMTPRAGRRRTTVKK